MKRFTCCNKRAKWSGVFAVIRLFILLLLSLPVYGDKVFNIYFCGTAMTSNWSDPDVSGFCSPELISQLYKYDLAEPNLAIPGKTRYKIIIDGIGTGSDYSIIDLFGQGFPDVDGIRGWSQCLQEAEQANRLILGYCDNDYTNLTLNLVGFSRGGILCMKFARLFADDPEPCGSPHINILTFDPVPGINPLQSPEGTISALQGADVLPDCVERFVGVYASDERSYQFEPLVPQIPPGTQHWLIRLRGAHETIVGNTQQDGHCISSLPVDYNIGGYRKGEQFIDQLKSISDISRAIAQELLTSRSWGNNQFAEEGLWYTNPNTRQQQLTTAINTMNAYGDDKYEQMQKTIVAAGWSSYNSFHYKRTGEYISEPYALWSANCGRFCYIGGKRSQHGFKFAFFPANKNLVFQLSDIVPLIDADTAWEKIEMLCED